MAFGRRRTRRCERPTTRSRNFFKGMQEEEADEEEKSESTSSTSGRWIPERSVGGEKESWRLWAKRVKAYCNARTPGFRKALEWAEAEAVPIDSASLSVFAWEHSEVANSKLFDMLIMKLSDDAFVLAENHSGNGFEAWRSLSRRYDPVGEQFVFDK